MNAEVHYQYRDAGNWKTHGSVIFAGEPTEALVNRLEGALLEGEYFVGRQVGVTEIAPWVGDPTELTFDLDHSFHELVEVMTTGRAPTDGRSFRAFVEAVERASREGWEQLRPIDRLTEDEMIGVVRDHLAEGARERALAWLEEAPASVAHRLDRRELRALLEEGACAVRERTLRVLGRCGIDAPGEGRGR